MTNRPWLPWCVLMGVAAQAAAQRDLTDIPPPDPELERATFQVAPGFEVNLFAADPLLAKPVQMNFDADGRLWIASSEVYPQIEPGQAANDKILILSDTNGDGRADNTRVFADGLLIPTGIVPGDGGAYVANSTELIHLADTTGDGRADTRRVVLSGFGTEDTHHLLHTLRWGPDGCLYAAQSIYIHSHIETPWGVRRLGGGGVWQFRPETQRLEVFARGWINPWGIHFDPFGQCFVTDGAGGEGINYAFPDAAYPTAVGAARVLHGLNPGSPKFCGLEIVGGRHLPDDWQDNLITCDFRAHRVCRFVLTDDNSGYASREQVELIKSTHVAFRPVDVKMGPDGAIYIADWYNPIIQHGEVDFRDPRRDKTHGRIWRVTATGRPLVERRPLSTASIDELTQALGQPELWTRQFARQTLKERANTGQRTEVLQGLARQVNALASAGDDRQRELLDLLWTYQACDEPASGLLTRLLAAGDARVRAAATRVAGEWGARLDRPMNLLAPRAADPHPRVRLEAIHALRRVGTVEAVRAAFVALDRPSDVNIDFALWHTARALQGAWLPGVIAGTTDLGGTRQLLFALQAVDTPATVPPLVGLLERGQLADEALTEVLEQIARHGRPDDLALVLQTVFQANGSSASQRAQILATLAAATSAKKMVPSGDLSPLADVLREGQPELQAAAARAVGVWKVNSMAPELIVLATTEGHPPALRVAAVEGLAALRTPQAVATLRQVAVAPGELLLSQTAIAELVAIEPAAAARAAVAMMVGGRIADPEPLLAPFVQRPGSLPRLAEALSGKQLPADVAKVAVRVVAAAPKIDEALLEALRSAGGLTAGPVELTADEMQALIDAVYQQGDAARGEIVYRREQNACQKCHALGGAGGRVGPDLSSIGGSARVDYLIESILLPNKAVKEGYHSIVVATTDGQVHQGIRLREDDREVVLRTSDDRELAIAANTIEEQAPGISLMPAGLAEGLTRGELVDLVRFLSELGKVGPYSLPQARYVRRWQTIVPTNEALETLRRNRIGVAASDDATFTWAAAYSRVDGSLPLDDVPLLASPRGRLMNLPPVSIVRFALEVTTAGPVELNLGDAAGLSVWHNGQPVDPAGSIRADLPRGVHVWTVVVDRARSNNALRVELVDVPDSPAQAQLVGGK